MSVDDSSSSPEQTLANGSTFAPYTVIRLLGKGGMGEVYEVEHQTLRRRYAIKLISGEIVGDDNSLERFMEEARETSRLEHPNIVRVDHFDAVDGQYYLRMELMGGVAAAPRESGARSQEPDEGEQDGAGVAGASRAEPVCRNLEELLKARG